MTLVTCGEGEFMAKASKRKRDTIPPTTGILPRSFWRLANLLRTEEETPIKKPQRYRRSLRRAKMAICVRSRKSSLPKMLLM